MMGPREDVHHASRGRAHDLRMSDSIRGRLRAGRFSARSDEVAVGRSVHVVRLVGLVIVDRDPLTNGWCGGATGDEDRRDGY